MLARIHKASSSSRRASCGSNLRSFFTFSVIAAISSGETDSRAAGSAEEVAILSVLDGEARFLALADSSRRKEGSEE